MGTQLLAKILEQMNMSMEGRKQDRASAEPIRLAFMIYHNDSHHTVHGPTVTLTTMTLREPTSFTVDRHNRFKGVAKALNIGVHGDVYLIGKVKLEAAQPASPRKCATTPQKMSSEQFGSPAHKVGWYIVGFNSAHKVGWFIVVFNYNRHVSRPNSRLHTRKYRQCSCLCPTLPLLEWVLEWVWKRTDLKYNQICELLIVQSNM